MTKGKTSADPDIKAVCLEAKALLAKVGDDPTVAEKEHASKLIDLIGPAETAKSEEAKALIPHLYKVLGFEALDNIVERLAQPSAEEEADEDFTFPLPQDLENAKPEEIHNAAVSIYNNTNDPKEELRALQLFELAAKKGLKASRDKAAEIRERLENIKLRSQE